ncbi:MAG: hypothetical protein ACLP8S_07915 [Solirubrobacteraceae bacterium]
MIERCRLEHLPADLKAPTGQPYRPAEDLRQKTRIAFRCRHLERALLLENVPQRKTAGSQKR